jgi:hypothetical protein
LNTLTSSLSLSFERAARSYGIGGGWNPFFLKFAELAERFFDGAIFIVVVRLFVSDG